MNWATEEKSLLETHIEAIKVALYQKGYTSEITWGYGMRLSNAYNLTIKLSPLSNPENKRLTHIELEREIFEDKLYYMPMLADFILRY